MTPLKCEMMMTQLISDQEKDHHHDDGMWGQTCHFLNRSTSITDDSDDTSLHRLPSLSFNVTLVTLNFCVWKECDFHVDLWVCPLFLWKSILKWRWKTCNGISSLLYSFFTGKVKCLLLSSSLFFLGINIPFSGIECEILSHFLLSTTKRVWEEGHLWTKKKNRLKKQNENESLSISSLKRKTVTFKLIHSALTLLPNKSCLSWTRNVMSTSKILFMSSLERIIKNGIFVHRFVHHISLLRPSYKSSLSEEFVPFFIETSVAVQTLCVFSFVGTRDSFWKSVLVITESG